MLSCSRQTEGESKSELEEGTREMERLSERESETDWREIWSEVENRAPRWRVCGVRVICATAV